MSNRTVTLIGTLISGVVGPGGETTGYVLRLSDLDLEFAERPALVPGSSYFVAGDFETRIFPLRGRVNVLRVRALASSLSGLSRHDLRASVFLHGTIRTDIVRPGGEGTGAVLVGAAPQVDVSGVKVGTLAGHEVVAAGAFEFVVYPLLGLQAIFKASALKPVPLGSSQPPRAAVGDALPAGPPLNQADGYSNSFSLEEAILDAIRQLPTSDIPDWLTVVHIASIDAELGGIAGLSRLKVHVTTAVPTTPGSSKPS